MGYKIKKYNNPGSVTEVTLPTIVGGIAVTAIASDAFTDSGITKINACRVSKIDGAPWGATSATVTYAELPQLNAPTIAVSGDTLTITPGSGDEATGYEIYYRVNGSSNWILGRTITA